MTANPVCYLCGGTDLDVVAEKFRYEVPKVGYRCRACSLVFIHPRMTPEEERKFYELEYGIVYSQEKNVTPRDLFQARQGEARLFLEWTSPYVKPADRALEIGCASGYFLDLLRPQVASVAGVETHNELRAYAQETGITMFADLAEVPKASADIVFIFFVLEHVGDPLGFLAAVRSVCRPGARVCIVVPNVDDALLSAYRLPKFRDFYFTPAHEFYYSPTTLSALFARAGVTRQHVAQYQRYDLSNHMQWMMDGRPGGMGRFDAFLGARVNDAYRAALVEHKMADTLFAVIEW